MGRPGFILQHVVDAFAVQTATADSKPIGVVFGLIGLYLHVEKRFSGRQVQTAHMELGRKKRAWPNLSMPEDRGGMTVMDVLTAPAGEERDAAIGAWCSSVWSACSNHREMLAAVLREHQIT
jgi:hypothetical protein